MGLNILLNVDHILINWSLQIYALAGDIYEFIRELASQSYLENGDIELFAKNIMVLVGVIMLFRLAIALIEYLADPDKMDDKTVGTSKLITSVLITVALLIACGPCFNFLRKIETAILEDGIIEKVFTANPSDDAETVVTGDGYTCHYSPSKYLGNIDINITAVFVNTMVGKRIRYVREESSKYVSSKIPEWTYDNKQSHISRGDNGKRVAQPAYVYYFASESGANNISSGGVNNCPEYAYLPFGLTSNTIVVADIFFADDPNAISSPKIQSFSTLPFAIGPWAYLVDAVINTKDLGKLESTSSASYINSTGRKFAGMMFFNYISCNDAADEKACQKFRKYESKNDISSVTNLLDTGIIDNDGMNANGYNAKAIEGNGLLTLAFGIVLVLYFITMTIDVAVRSLKLTILQLLAPIPIMSYATPKTKNVFDSWIKTIGSVYADLFIRIIIISLISFITGKLFPAIRGQGFTTIVMILGLLMFMKEAPQFICNMLGIKGTGDLKIGINPFQKLREMPIVGGAMGAAAGAVGGAISGAKTGGFMGGVMGAASGGSAGWKNSGGMMGQDAGKRPQTGSGAVGSKAGQAFMQGKGGFWSRTVGAGAARAYVGNEKFAADENAARRAATNASQKRSFAQAKLDMAQGNLTEREADVRRAQMGVDAARARYEADPTDTINKSRLTTAEATLATSVSAYERTASHVKNYQNDYNMARSADEKAQADLSDAERVRKKAQSIVEDKPNTARDVRHR